jgi:hypothetical protein
VTANKYEPHDDLAASLPTSAALCTSVCVFVCVFYERHGTVKLKKTLIAVKLVAMLLHVQKLFSNVYTENDCCGSSWVLGEHFGILFPVGFR